MARACCPTCGQTLKAARLTVPRKPQNDGPIDTSELTDAQLFAHYKRTAIAWDLAFFLRLDISPALRAHAESITKPTAKDISALRTLWRIERQTADMERGIPSIGSPRWAEYQTILTSAEDDQAVTDAEYEGLAS